MQEAKFFDDINELVKYVKWKVLKWVGSTDVHQYHFKYNRMTGGELVQEVLLKVISTSRNKEDKWKSLNRTYINTLIQSKLGDLVKKVKALELSLDDKDLMLEESMNALQEHPRDITAMTEEAETFSEVKKEISLRLLAGDKLREIGLAMGFTVNEIKALAVSR